MDEQNKNLILATALSFAVILVWFLLFPPPEADPALEPGTEISETVEVLRFRLHRHTVAARHGRWRRRRPRSRCAALAAAPRVAIATDKVSGSISLMGGRIDDLK